MLILASDDSDNKFMMITNGGRGHGVYGGEGGSQRGGFHLKCFVLFVWRLLFVSFLSIFAKKKVPLSFTLI